MRRFIFWGKNRQKVIEKILKIKIWECLSLLKLILLGDNKLDGEEKVPTKADYVKKEKLIGQLYIVLTDLSS